SSSLLSVPLSFLPTAPTEIYTLSLHDALPIWSRLKPRRKYWLALPLPECCTATMPGIDSSSSAVLSIGRISRSAPLTEPSLAARSEEHTSELQSRENLVCRLLLEKKKQVEQNH